MKSKSEDEADPHTKMMAALRRLLDGVPSAHRRVVAARLLNYLELRWIELDIIELDASSREARRAAHYSADRELDRMDEALSQIISSIMLRDLANRLTTFPRDELQLHLERVAHVPHSEGGGECGNPPLGETG